MRRAIGKVLILGLAAAVLGACTPAPSVSVEEAERILSGLARGERVVDVCTPEGERAFRDAVRVRARQEDAEGRDWPAFYSDEDDSALLEPEAAVVSIGYFAGWVQASDLRGSTRARLRRWSIEHWPDLGRVRAHADAACAEFATLQVAGARWARVTQRRSTTSRSGLERAERDLRTAIDALQARLQAEGVDL
jgi:hypothetical protein